MRAFKSFLDGYKQAFRNAFYLTLLEHVPEGGLPPLTPQQKERALLKKEPDELAEELKGRTLYSDIFNRRPPPEGYFETAVLQPAPPAQKMPAGDTRPRWKYV